MTIDKDTRGSLEKSIAYYLATEERGGLIDDITQTIAETSPFPEEAKDIVDIVEKSLGTLIIKEKG